MKKIIGILVTGLILTMGTSAYCKEPVENISAKRHPNLAAAQHLCAQAYDKITAAQKANEWDMDGHAQKAKELLDKVNEELKLAAEAANKNENKPKK